MIKFQSDFISTHFVILCFIQLFSLQYFVCLFTVFISKSTISIDTMEVTRIGQRIRTWK